LCATRQRHGAEKKKQYQKIQLGEGENAKEFVAVLVAEMHLDAAV